MVKKLFALASVTALAGLVSAVGVTGCTSESDPATPATDGGTDAPKTKDAAPPPGDDDDDDDDLAPSKTVGKECTSQEDCEVENTENVNVCSKGAFKDGDIFGSPICVGPCTPTTKENPTIADILCDGEMGVCIGQTQGTCFGLCQYDATKIEAPCAGGNKCAAAYNLTKQDGSGGAVLGICYAACTKDADCKGSAGQKCQTETGMCVKEAVHKTFTKTLGDGCSATSAEEECNCGTVRGTGPDKDKGYCTSTCITGAAGDAACSALADGWKCNVGIARKDNDGKDYFTAQPDDVLGVCAKPCTTVADCADLATAAGVEGGAKGKGTVECTEFAAGKFCNLTEVE